MSNNSDLVSGVMRVSTIPDLKRMFLRNKVIRELKRSVFRYKHGVKDILISETLFVATWQSIILVWQCVLILFEYMQGLQTLILFSKFLPSSYSSFITKLLWWDGLKVCGKNHLLYLEIAKSGIGKNAKDMVILSKAINFKVWLQRW